MLLWCASEPIARRWIVPTCVWKQVLEDCHKRSCWKNSIGVSVPVPYRSDVYVCSKSCWLCLTVVYWLLECNKVPSWNRTCEYVTIYYEDTLLMYSRFISLLGPSGNYMHHLFSQSTILHFILMGFFFFPVLACAITASRVPGGTFVSMNRFSTLCGWLAQRQGWSEYDRVSKRDRLGLTPDLTTRWATGNDNFVYSCLWDFMSSVTCRKILRHGTFRLYFPSERKVCCGFLSPLKIRLLGRVMNPQHLGPVASTLTTTPPRRHSWVSYGSYC
jgi:hypothetical protein